MVVDTWTLADFGDRCGIGSTRSCTAGKKEHETRQGWRPQTEVLAGQATHLGDCSLQFNRKWAQVHQGLRNTGVLAFSTEPHCAHLYLKH